MLLPIRLVAGGWPRAVERRLARFVWQDPALLLKPDVSPEQFRTGMSALYVGQTIKITGSDRHGPVDDLLLQRVDLDGARIVDLGASDGSTSVDLVHRLPTFGSFVIADRFLYLDAARDDRRVAFFTEDGGCILLAGCRLIAWPSQSRMVALLYRRAVARIRQRTSSRLLLLNPDARRLVGDDSRVTYQVHDVFDPWPEPKPDVIKVANVLRRLYFTDDQIRRALTALRTSLPDGGHLLLLDNPRIAGIDIRGGLYRREGDGFTLVATTPERPEVADLLAELQPTRGLSA